MTPAHFRLLNRKQGHLTRGTDSESGTPAAETAIGVFRKFISSFPGFFWEELLYVIYVSSSIP